MTNFNLLYRTAITLSCLLVCPSVMRAEHQGSDTIAISKTEEKNRNVMLNATTQTKPREVSIGLPGSDWGSVIFEDGLPVSYSSWPVYYYFKWSGGNAYTMQGLMKVGESAVTCSSIGYSINSWTDLGSDTIGGKVTFTTSNFGLLRGDAHVSGPMKRDWYYSANAYVNYDPTSVHPRNRHYINQSQIYKVALTKKWGNKTSLSLLYKYIMNNDGTYGYNTGPFYYNGDGSISEYDGFRLGHDCYFPVDDKVEYMDIETGEIVHNRLNDMNMKHLHDATVMFMHRLGGSWVLHWNTRVSTTHNMDNLGIFDSGIDDIGTELAQQRFGLLCRSNYTDLMSTLEVTGHSGRHTMRFGFNQWLSWQKQTGSSFVFATTVTPNPTRIDKDGRSTWSYNAIGEYYKGHETKTGLFFTDDWTPVSKLNVYYGGRLEVLGINVDGVNNVDGKTNNTRCDGFNLNAPGVTINNTQKTWLDPTAMAQLYYTPIKVLSIVGEYIYNVQHPGIVAFKNAALPELKALVTQMGRAGVTFSMGGLTLTSMASVLNVTGNNGSGHFTKLVNGNYETRTGVSFYDIRTLGWTTDVVYGYRGFNMHFLVTFQNPQYKNYHNKVTFSDGSTETFDYSDMVVSGVPKILLEIDPSYSFGKWNVWASARYYGRQYANKLNNVWFNGHWETFAGVKFAPNRYFDLSVNVINLLNQTGANGTIDVADTILDDNILKGYLTSGTYIRPFTVEFSATVKF